MRSLPLTTEPSGQAFSTETVTMQWERLLAAFMAVAGGEAMGAGGRRVQRTTQQTQFHVPELGFRCGVEASTCLCAERWSWDAAGHGLAFPWGLGLTLDGALRQARLHEAHQLLLVRYAHLGCTWASG